MPIIKCTCWALAAQKHLDYRLNLLLLLTLLAAVVRCFFFSRFVEAFHSRSNMPHEMQFN